MKNLFTNLILLITVIGFAMPQFLSAQSPEKLSYQAVIRNVSNALVTNQQVGMKISILQGSATGIPMYGETHIATTNANGLISIAIGTGTPVINAFTDVDWSAGPYFIKTETDPTGGTNYTITATSELLSVPYALYAKTAKISDKTKAAGVTGQVQFNNEGVLGGDPDFFWDSAQKRLGIGTSGAAAINSPLDVRNLSGTAIIGVSYDNGAGIRGYEYSSYGNPGKGVSGISTSEGGIGVEGYSDFKTGITYGVYGSVSSPDGFGIFGANRASSGNAVGIHGTSASTSGIGVYGESKYIGVSGANLSKTGSGYGVRGEVYSPDGSIAVMGSSHSLTGTTVGVYGATQSSSGIGVYGFGAATAGNNKGVVGYTNSPDGFSGWFSSGKFYVNGKVGVGTEAPGAGIHLKGTGFPDTFMFLEAAAGNDAGLRIYEGATAKWHIFNDVNAGGLRMYNTAAATALFLKQSNSFVGINTTNPLYNLEVNGTAGKLSGGSWSNSSDIRLKDVTGNYTKGLKEITALQPVSFVYKAGNARHLPGNVPQIGFVAQEVQKVFPEAVTKGDDGYLDFNIHAINVALVNAVKELKAENERLKAENDQLKMITDKNEARLTEVENKLQMLMKTN